MLPHASTPAHARTRNTSASRVTLVPAAPSIVSDCTPNLLAHAHDSSLRPSQVARCLVSLKEFSSAQKELEAVPAEYRDVRVNALLGKLYQMSGLKRHAISSYKLAFEEMPFAVEIIEALVTLGISQAELADLIARGLARCPLEGGGASEGQGQSPLRRDTSSAAAPPRMSHAHNNCSEDYREWLPRLGNALVSKRACSFPDCNLNFRWCPLVLIDNCPSHT